MQQLTSIHTLSIRPRYEVNMTTRPVQWWPQILLFLAYFLNLQKKERVKKEKKGLCAKLLCMCMTCKKIKFFTESPQPIQLLNIVAHIDASGYSSVLLNNIAKENLLNIILRTHAFTINLPPKS